MIYYLALCRLQLIFIIWPYLIYNHIILFGIYYKSGEFRDRKNVINKLRVPLFDSNTEQAS